MLLQCVVVEIVIVPDISSIAVIIVVRSVLVGIICIIPNTTNVVFPSAF